MRSTTASARYSGKEAGTEKERGSRRPGRKSTGCNLARGLVWLKSRSLQSPAEPCGADGSYVTAAVLAACCRYGLGSVDLVSNDSFSYFKTNARAMFSIGAIVLFLGSLLTLLLSKEQQHTTLVRRHRRSVCRSWPMTLGASCVCDSGGGPAQGHVPRLVAARHQRVHHSASCCVEGGGAAAAQLLWVEHALLLRLRLVRLCVSSSGGGWSR